jgi:hypothetical protein
MYDVYAVVTTSELDALRAALAAAWDALEALERGRIDEPSPWPARHAAPRPEELEELF